VLIDEDTCYRALRTRDRRFDGRFFTAVLTTGVYCRPVCPARTPYRRNVRFYACAAAAEEAGFRACRRCHPEAAPGTPVWAGSAAAVSRAVRLIEGGALDGEPVAALADRVGLGERQLRRLFVEHLGTSPLAVATTRRAHLARSLIAETSLQISEIALASGFGSIRQFNDAFRAAFGQPPSALRKGSPARPGGAMRLRLGYRPPYDWDAALGFLAARAVEGVERVEGGKYARTFRVGRDAGVLRVSKLDGAEALELEISGGGAAAAMELVRRVRRLLDLDADPMAIGQVLCASPLLRPLVRARPGLRLIGAFEPFEAAVRAVLAQQVSVAAARTFGARLVRGFGEEVGGAHGLSRAFPTAQALASEELDGIGLTRQRKETLRALALGFSRGKLKDAARSPEALEAALSEIPGVGEWTAAVVAMRALAEPDAFPAADLALRRAAGNGSPLSEPELLELSSAWRPFRAYAAMHLWSAPERRPEERRADRAVEH